MESIIRAIYNGELDAGDLSQGYSEAFRASKKAYWDYAAGFRAKLEHLAPSLAEEFQEVLGADLDYLYYEDADIFVTGFRLGAKLMMEVLDGSSPQKAFSADQDEKEADG